MSFIGPKRQLVTVYCKLVAYSSLWSCTSLSVILERMKFRCCYRYPSTGCICIAVVSVQDTLPRRKQQIFSFCNLHDKAQCFYKVVVISLYYKAKRRLNLARHNWAVPETCHPLSAYYCAINWCTWHARPYCLLLSTSRKWHELQMRPWHCDHRSCIFTRTRRLK